MCSLLVLTVSDVARYSSRRALDELAGAV